MSEDVQKPPVIDLELLLQPIEGENPSGESVRYSGVYDEISEARRADDTLSQGDWQWDPKLADYNKVIDLALPVLSTQSKDLQIAAWLTESLVRVHGFAGLRDGLKLVSGLQANFWETLFPEVDEGDQEGRANAIAWLDKEAAYSAKSAPIVAGAGYGVVGYEDSKRFDVPENIDAFDSEEQARYLALRTQAENENRVTGDMWRRAKAQTRRSFCEETLATLQECREAYAELDSTIEAHFERNQMPGLGALKKFLDEAETVVKKLLEEKKIEEPDESDDTSAEGEGEYGEDGEAVASGGGVSMGGAVKSRREALTRLAEIASFFQKTEPHSPVAYLVQRAVKWGNMPLETWLQDVIKDDGVLHQLRQTLGLDTGDAGDSSYSEETPAQEWS